MTPEQQDAFLNPLKNPDGSVSSFTKDTTLVHERLRRVVAEFGGDIRLSGPPDALNQALKQTAHGTWELSAPLEHIGPGRR